MDNNKTQHIIYYSQENRVNVFLDGDIHTDTDENYSVFYDEDDEYKYKGCFECNNENNNGIVYFSKENKVNVFLDDDAYTYSVKELRKKFPN